jgi:hypothetical protein
MATVWLSYAWDDNTDGDVDFVAQELEKAGVNVRLDRFAIQAGHRLWEQIASGIQDSATNGWILFASQNSLNSEPCKEEFAYALDRALVSRGEKFPIIGVFQGSYDYDLIPLAIRTRLYVSLTDPDWKERIVASVESRTPQITRPIVDPFSIIVYALADAGGRIAIEVRPRAGSWSPFLAGIPIHEKDIVSHQIRQAPSGKLPGPGPYIRNGYASSLSSDGQWWIESEQRECTPTQSFFIYCNQLPSKLAFGVDNGEPVYIVEKAYLTSRFAS